MTVAYSTFLGYDKGEDGKLEINVEQAEVVKLIYRLYLIGYSAYHIKEKLEEMKIKSPTGKARWHCSTVANILSNEKYKGDALLQKQYTVDFLTKKTKKNEGEVPQVYVENDHEAIIDRKCFDLVQIEVEKRKSIKHYSDITIFSNKIVCGECGAYFGRKVWHSTDKYRAEIYRCNEKYNGKTCGTGHITEDEIKSKFIEAYNLMYKDRTKLIEDAEYVKMKMTPTAKDIKDRDNLVKASDDICKKADELIKLNSIQKQNQKKYNEDYNALVEESNKISEKLKALDNKIKDKEARVHILEEYINTLKTCKKKLVEFDEGLFAALVDKMVVYKEKVQVVWRDGSKADMEIYFYNKCIYKSIFIKYNIIYVF